MRLLIMVLFLAWPVFDQQPQSHSCVPASAAQRTAWGNMTLVVNTSLRDKPIKTVRGVVEGWSVSSTKDPQNGVLVEIYSYRQGDPTRTSSNSDKQAPRLYACITAANGSFKFDVPSGSYEVIASKKDCKTSIVLVTVDTKKGKSKALKIDLEAAT